jgi:hypothetical protein
VLFLTKDVLEVISEKKTLGATDRENLAKLVLAHFPPTSPEVGYINSPAVQRRGF